MINPRIETYNYYRDRRVQASMFNSVWEVIHQERFEAIVAFDKEWLEKVIYDEIIVKRVNEWVDQKHPCAQRCRELEDLVALKSAEHKDTVARARKNGNAWSQEVQTSRSELCKLELRAGEEREKLYKLAEAELSLEAEIKKGGFHPYGEHPYCLQLRTKFEVCGECRGSGKVVNPSIDCCGLTEDDFYDDPGFEEAYFSGLYDIVCPRCLGLRVKAIPDFPEWLDSLIQRHNESQWEMIWISCAERAMGA